MQPYNFNEILAILAAIGVGSLAYITFVWKKKLEKITFKMVLATISMSAFITFLASEVVNAFNLEKYRSLILLPASFLAQWFIEWAFTRHPKLFDAGFKKVTGVDITEPNNMNNETDIPEHPEGGNNS